MYAEISIQPTPVFDGATPVYEFTLVNERDEPIELGQLLTLTLTLYDYPSLTLRNSRRAQNVLNANNVTVSLTGVVTWAMQAADTTRVSAATLCATHEACFDFTYNDNGATRANAHKARFFIVPGALVPPLAP